MTREQAVIMFSACVLIMLILGGAVLALSAKYTALEAEHFKVISAYAECEGGTP